MADAIISPLLERLIDFIAQQIQNQVNLVSGVEKEILDLSDQLRTVRTVLDDAERKGFQDKSVRDWLKRLETACCEMDDVLEEWHYNILRQQMEQQSNASAALKHKVCSFVPSPSACLSFEKVSFHRRVGKKIKQVKVKLDRILVEKDQYGFTTGQPTDPFGGSWRIQSTSYVEVENVCGRNDDKDILMSKLMPNDFNEETSGIQVISIVGIGGIGKTTLTQLVYNENRVKECYPLRIWICVSDPFDTAVIAKGIVQSAGGTTPDTNQLDNLLKKLREAIEGKKFLLVLDDVRTEDSARWEPLKTCLNFGAPGSKLLVTTRNERVAKMMGTTENMIHRPRVLSDDDCWLLLSRIAFFDRSENECQSLKGIGREIADRCEGLPLAANVMGSMLRFKHGLEGWESVLHSEMWQLEEAEVDIFPHLLLTYNELTPVVKRCFSYCAIFPKDYVIDVEKDLIQNWLALGYLGSDESACDLEVRGRQYFDNLAMRSFFQGFRRTRCSRNSTIISCKMHDIVHGFARFVRNNSSSGRIQATCKVCHSIVSHVKEYRSLTILESVPYMCDCLKSLKVLHFQLDYMRTVPKDIVKLIHLRQLNLDTRRELPAKDIKLICKLYNLKFLVLSHCSIEEIPVEIGNLIGLRKLDLSGNKSLKELPERIGDLHQLRSLNIAGCKHLCGLPQGILKLTKLKHLDIGGAFSKGQYADDIIGKMSGVQTLRGFSGKLSWLKKLNQLSGDFEVRVPKIPCGEGVIDARDAELNKKVQLDHLTIVFSSAHDQSGVADALEPHPNLIYLTLWGFATSKLPDWIFSTINQLKHIQLHAFMDLALLPALGKLPCLERLQVGYFSKLEFVGRNFLGITTPPSSSSSVAIGFPKLEILIFIYCEIWKEWEDITAEEEASTELSLFPCLKRLIFHICKSLNTLPHRLLRKAPVFEELRISGCEELEGRYDKRRDDSSWKYISHIPRVTISFDRFNLDIMEDQPWVTMPLEFLSRMWTGWRSSRNFGSSFAGLGFGAGGAVSAPGGDGGQPAGEDD